METLQRRESDKVFYKFKTISGMVTAIGIIGTAILFVGSLFFQTTKEAKACEQRATAKIETVEKNQSTIREDVVEIKTDIKYIREGIRELKKRL